MRIKDEKFLYRLRGFYVHEIQGEKLIVYIVENCLRVEKELSVIEKEEFEKVV